MPLPPDSSRHALAREWALARRAEFKTVVLATCSPEGEPDASVAGAVLAPDGAFFIYVSSLAAHTRNLLATSRASILLAEDEATAAQPLARRRLTFACTVEPIARGTDDHAAALRALRERLGPAFELVSSLGDFQLLRLRPQRGRLVAGFGQAYEIDPGDWTPRSPPIGSERRPTGPR